eukprot:16120201-Heterocapsa_arctica.AAC.1
MAGACRGLTNWISWSDELDSEPLLATRNESQIPCLAVLACSQRGTPASPAQATYRLPNTI